MYYVQFGLAWVFGFCLTKLFAYYTHKALRVLRPRTSSIEYYISCFRIENEAHLFCWWYYKQLTCDNPRLSPLLIHVIIQESVVSHVMSRRHHKKSRFRNNSISFLNIMNNHDLHIWNSALQYFVITTNKCDSIDISIQRDTQLILPSPLLCNGHLISYCV